MSTEWIYRVFLFVRTADATPANKAAFAQMYVDAGSGETLADESLLLDNVTRFSTSGNEPAQAYGINTAAKLSMRDGFTALLGGLTNARYAVIEQGSGTLIRNNFAGISNGITVTWAQALARLEADFGLVVIEP